MIFPLKHALGVFIEYCILHLYFLVILRLEDIRTGDITVPEYVPKWHHVQVIQFVTVDKSLFWTGTLKKLHLDWGLCIIFLSSGAL